jgi:hypothetical protein
MKFTLIINLDNAAFYSERADHHDLRDGDEIARVLRQLANRLDDAYVDCTDRGTLRDRNGNTVGAWQVAGD